MTQCPDGIAVLNEGTVMVATLTATNPARSSVNSALEPLRGVALLAGDSVKVARQDVNWRAWRTYTAIVFSLAILGDIITTQWMMSSGLTEEGNPVAAAGMLLVGQTGYVILASLLMASMMTLLLARPRHYAGWVAQGMVLLILLVKIEVVWNNIGLWTGAWTGLS